MKTDLHTSTLNQILIAGQEFSRLHRHAVLDFHHALKAMIKYRHRGYELLKELCEDHNISINTLENAVDKAIKGIPSQEHTSTSLYTSKLLENVLEVAYNKGMSEFGDSFVGTDVFLLSSFQKKIAERGHALVEVFPELSYHDLRNFIKNKRKNFIISHYRSEETTETIKKFAFDLTQAAREGKQDPVIGRDEEIRRLISSLSRKTKNNPILVGEAGVGKAQPLSSLVLTPTGFVPMGSLKLGDLVVTPTGGMEPIVGIFEQGTLQSYTVTFKDGRQVEACGQHLWKVFDGKNWEVAETLVIKDKLDQGKTCSIPLVYYTQSSNWSFVRELRKKFHPQNIVQYGARQKNANNQKKHKQTIKVKKISVDFGEKHFDRQEFERFIWASGATFRTAGPNYIIYYREVPGNRLDTTSDTSLLLGISSIEPSSIQPMRCIKLADEDNLYVTDNHIVTHNTAILEGLAQRIVRGQVPDNLRSCQLFSLDLGSLLAGTAARGEFEERLKLLIEELKASEGRAILFIDEIHTLMGAGSTGGALDASNLLKPAMARGEFRLIGATTLDEYREHIEKDKALVRRMPRLDVVEPSPQEAITILRGIKTGFETHHGVSIKDEALEQAVKLSVRYLASKRLPDKAVDLIDEACAKVRMSINAMPEELVKLQSELLEERLKLQSLLGEEDGDIRRIHRLEQQVMRLEKEFASQHAAWEKGREIVEELRTAREDLSGANHLLQEALYTQDLEEAGRIKNSVVPAIEAKIKELLAKQEEMGSILNETVSTSDILYVLSKWTGIPLSKLEEGEKEKLLQLDQRLKEKVVGQDEAVEAVKRAILRNRAGVASPHKPIGSFLFAGPSGSGKTLLAKELAKELFDSELAVLRLDMSEYMEKHSVSRLIGPPPGYIGYEEGGVLTEHVKNNAYSLVLLDEVEKAHPDVLTLLLQVFDAGRLTDSKGTVVDFKNTILIMTSNIGAHLMLEEGAVDKGAYREEVKGHVRAELLNFFRPELLNRLNDIIFFKPLDALSLRKVVALGVKAISERLEEQKLALLATDEAMDKVWQEAYSPELGARSIQKYLEDIVEYELSMALLSNSIPQGSLLILVVDAESGGFDFRTAAMDKEASVLQRVEEMNEEYKNKTAS